MKSKILNRQSNAVACLKHKLINRHRGPTFSDHSLMVQSNDDVSSKCEKSSWPGDRWKSMPDTGPVWPSYSSLMPVLLHNGQNLSSFQRETSITPQTRSSRSNAQKVLRATVLLGTVCSSCLIFSIGRGSRGQLTGGVKGRLDMIELLQTALRYEVLLRKVRCAAPSVMFERKHVQDKLPSNLLRAQRTSRSQAELRAQRMKNSEPGLSAVFSRQRKLLTTLLCSNAWSAVQ